MRSLPLKARPIPPDSAYKIGALKELIHQLLPKMQQTFAANRPASLTETERYIPVCDGWLSHTIVCHRSTQPCPAPLIVLFFGGGHCIGYPETEIPLARALVLALDAVVVCPSYRLAPEHPSPVSFNDS